ncbi:MAG TPA: DedA family protein [Solirubrobacteraceae bacterium]|nr:DedA family protein [Solirubrobacteraceae bacterium]
MKPLPLIGGGLLLAGVIAGQRRFSRTVNALMAVAALALIAVGTGLVDPPNLEHAIRDLAGALGSWTYALVGVMAFLETGAGIGLIAPGELAVILGGVAAGQGEVELGPLIALVWICAVAGDTLSYILGRRLGRGFLLEHGHRVKLTEERLEQVERYFARHGGKTILFGRFIGWVRALAPFIAGASRMPARRFVPATIVAAGLWAVACTLLGYVFWNSLDHAVELARQGSLAIAGVVALVALGTYAVKRRRRRMAADTGR